MKRFNTDPSFAGYPKMKSALSAQVSDFEQWAQTGDWERFHSAHYDWWAFPVNRRSAYGFTWTVYEGDIDELMKDPIYMGQLQKGLSLVAASWGWDIRHARQVLNPQPGQGWHNWPVRLFKAALCAQLFQLEDDFISLKKYAQQLMREGEVFEYNGFDLAWLFTTGIDPAPER